MIVYFFYIEFECYSNEHCNFHGSCNNATGKCVCDTKWRDIQDCSGNFLMYLTDG